MKDVPDKGHGQPVKSSAVLADREQVKQCLRRVLVHPVSSVDDSRFQTFCEEMRSSRSPVPNDDQVDAHRLDVACGIDEGLALGQTAG